jgi:hypothetical protein
VRVVYYCGTTDPVRMLTVAEDTRSHSAWRLSTQWYGHNGGGLEQALQARMIRTGEAVRAHQCRWQVDDARTSEFPKLLFQEHLVEPLGTIGPYTTALHTRNCGHALHTGVLEAVWWLH